MWTNKTTPRCHVCCVNEKVAEPYIVLYGNDGCQRKNARLTWKAYPKHFENSSILRESHGSGKSISPPNLEDVLVHFQHYFYFREGRVFAAREGCQSRRNYVAPRLGCHAYMDSVVTTTPKQVDRRESKDSTMIWVYESQSRRRYLTGSERKATRGGAPYYNMLIACSRRFAHLAGSAGGETDSHRSSMQQRKVRCDQALRV